jgi:hypothetical protein
VITKNFRTQKLLEQRLMEEKVSKTNLMSLFKQANKKHHERAWLSVEICG